MNRRKNKRIMVDLPVRYLKNQQARAINISINGLKIEVNKLLTKGSILFIVLNLHGEDLNVIGEVRWSKPCQECKFENGIEFFYMDREYKKIIKEFIENQKYQHTGDIIEYN